MVKEGRLVGCQARSERLNVYVIQVFGPDQAERDKTGSHEWTKPFTWCAPEGVARWPLVWANPYPYSASPTTTRGKPPARVLLPLAGPVRPPAVDAPPHPGNLNPHHPGPSPARRPSCQAEYGIPGACSIAAALPWGQGGAGPHALACSPRDPQHPPLFAWFSDCPPGARLACLFRGH